jgi:hypothetical protein
MRKNIFEIYGSKSAVVIRFEADVMDDSDPGRTGDIALDFDASAGVHFSRILRLLFRNARSITARVVVTGCNKTIACCDSSFKPSCLVVKRTPGEE